jgi:frataxin-like iron-binding protein CyaY
MEEVFEQWRTISGYPNYMISNCGRVMTIKSGKIRTGKAFNNGYTMISLNHVKSIYIHHLVAEAFLDKPNTDDRLIIDHINRDKSNNNASNLRWITQSLNLMNRSKSKKSPLSSKYKGVCFKSDKQKWCAKITKDGQDIFLGYFDSEEEAAHFYNLKAKELFGAFALLNEVDYDPEIHTTQKRKLSSLFRGVHFAKSKNKWRARLVIDGQEMHIGNFNTEVEAAIAYNKKASEILGDKAKLNILE